MGLVQRVIEASGVPTVGISIMRKLTEMVRPPRTVFVHYPMGHPLGEPFKTKQQRAITLDALNELTEAKEPGIIKDLPYKWKRHEWD
ncbi:MAG: hypothetical protein KAR06_07015 [Deltaproteobacteria bacterium]|nr:hypothetical protein [Deltaproteobacteria bacterium]